MDIPLIYEYDKSKTNLNMKQFFNFVTGGTLIKL